MGGPARLEELTRDECLDLLASGQIGRVAVSIAALPAVLPVNYALLDGAIVFRTEAGTKLSAATTNTVVAFEVDHTDDTDRVGWSVMVVGPASEITSAETLARARSLPLDSWVDGEHFVRVEVERISGRRLVRDSVAV